TACIDLGRPQQLARRLISISERHHIDVEHDPIYGRAHSWARRRATTWPMAEELFVTAPARVINKQPDGRRLPRGHAAASRTRGDGPRDPADGLVHFCCSPHPRGWSRHRPARREVRHLLPAPGGGFIEQ
ncbi:hypothetical protein ACUJ8H_45565, partial [Streptomyces sp. EKR5.2]